MTEHAVVIAGGGPTGLMLAAELALAKVDVAVVERRPDHVLADSRAGGIHARTIEVLDQRGVADRFLAEGQVAQAATFGTTVMDMSDFPTRHPYSLGIFQNQIERIMAAWIAELPVRIYYGCDVTGFAQEDTGVDVRLSDGEPLRARYLVGCDGGRSLIRKAAGIEFPGWDPTRSNLIAEVELTEEPPPGVRHDTAGVHGLHRMQDGKTFRVVTTEQQLGPDSEPTLRELSEALIAVYGTDFGIHNPTWISRFTDMTRQAAAYRVGRVVLAGDAAHVHYPAGGQGLSLGVQDAVNLGWKLAQVVAGSTPESLLDTYQAERHPVAARALRYTMAQTALQSHDERIKAVVDVVSEVASMDEPRKRLAGLISGLDIQYDLGEGHPLLGRRMPDLDLLTADGPLRMFTLLHDARPVLLNLGEPGGLDITPWADRVRLIDAEYAGTWELPVLGAVTAPSAVLIRPDGYVAWVGDGTDRGLPGALTTWFGMWTAEAALGEQEEHEQQHGAQHKARHRHTRAEHEGISARRLPAARPLRRQVAARGDDDSALGRPPASLHVDTDADAQAIVWQRDDTGPAAKRARRSLEQLHLRRAAGPTQQLVVGQPAYLVKTQVDKLPDLDISNVRQLLHLLIASGLVPQLTRSAARRPSSSVPACRPSSFRRGLRSPAKVAAGTLRTGRRAGWPQPQRAAHALGQVPVPLPEQLHRRRHEDRAHDRGVEQDRGARARGRTPAGRRSCRPGSRRTPRS